jgi:hypothetical protein
VGTPRPANSTIRPGTSRSSRAPGDPLRLRSVSKAVDSRWNSGPDLLAEHAPAAGGGPNPA